MLPDVMASALAQRQHRWRHVQATLLIRPQPANPHPAYLVSSQVPPGKHYAQLVQQGDDQSAG